MDRKLRLTTGLVMAVFVIFHLINHTLGLLSLQLMEDYRHWFVLFWHHPLPTVALYGSVLIHLLLALRALYRRTTLRMPFWEAAQLLLGLAIPPLVLAHGIGTRGAAEVLAVEASFEVVIGTLWSSPALTLRQTLLVLVVWAHLLFGIHYWLRLKPGYQRWQPLLQTLASLLPVLALLGFLRAALEVEKLETAQGALTLQYQQPEGVALLQSLERGIWIAYLLALLAVLLARYLRKAKQVNRNAVVIEHSARGSLIAASGATLLDALRSARVPHASVCGGRARCTTCRVRITRGAEHLLPPEEEEIRALQGVHAEPGVRLACQLRLTGNIGIVPLVPPERALEYVGRPGGVEGAEKTVAVLFVDLRGSTALGEKRLPYDVVFILNQFFSAMAEALEQTDGHYAQFNGDGLMALYGLESGVEAGCRQALRGAAEMLSQLDRLNKRLERELESPLRVGIGIHSGEAIVGTMGPPASPIVSAIGDTINTAARLEAETRVLGGPLIVSAVTLQRAGTDIASLHSHQVSVRGRREPLQVVVMDEQQLAGLTD